QQPYHYSPGEHGGCHGKPVERVRVRGKFFARGGDRTLEHGGVFTRDGVHDVERDAVQLRRYRLLSRVAAAKGELHVIQGIRTGISHVEAFGVGIFVAAAPIQAHISQGGDAVVHKVNAVVEHAEVIHSRGGRYEHVGA